MHPVSNKFFGQSGIPCVYSGGLGYIVKQISSNKYLVSNGTSTQVCSLAKNAYDTPDINNIPDGMMTILMSDDGIIIENIKKLQSQAFTFDNNVYPWQLSDLISYNNNYTLHELPLVANAYTFTPYGCSNNGSIFVGTFVDANSINQAVYYSNGAYTQLTNSNSLGCYAVCCSSNGHIIVGDTVGIGNSFSQVGYWTNGVVTLLSYLPGADTNPFDAGDASYVQACSADGSLIVGGSRTANTDVNGHAVYWKNNQIHDLTLANGISTITTNTILNSEAYDCSADGTIIIGSLNDDQSNFFNVIWAISNGNATATVYNTLGNINAISGDGMTIIGTSNNGNICYIDNNIITLLPYFADVDEVYPVDLNYNGNTITGGYATNSYSNSYAVCWNNDNIIKLPTLLAYPFSEAYCISGDGTIIGGTLFDNNTNIAVYWKKN